MKLIKKKYIYIINIKKIIKLNNNYIKNIKLIFEINNIYKYFIFLNHAFTGSHHFDGIYIYNFKNKGWYNNILKYFNFKINYLCLNNINSIYGSTNKLSFNIFYNKFYDNNFIKINYKYLIKLKYLLIKNLKLINIICMIGGSFGGIETLIWKNFYFNKIKFYLVIASNIYLDIKNFLLNKLNKLICYYYLNKNKYFNLKIRNIKSLKLIRILNYYTYNTKIDFIKKNKYKNYFYINIKKKLYIKKNINNYINYNCNFFVKKFNINSILFYLKLLKKFKLSFNFNKYIKSVFIWFKRDNRFILNYNYILIKKLLKLNFINIFKIDSDIGHDGFLKFNSIYINILNKYFKLIGAIGFEPMTI